MAINRPLFKNAFRETPIPDWTCPSCKTGVLRAESKNLKSYQSATSLENRSYDDWEPEWITGVFLGLLKCNNPSCKETVVVTGNMSVNQDQEYDEQYDSWNITASEILTPNCFTPTIDIFQIHKDVPDIIKNEIINAFKIYWLDIAACANKIRMVVELIMDERKIPKIYLEGKKRKGYSLHRRIKLFKLNNPEKAELLMAIKWIGNSGSHATDTLTKDDILDAFEILEHVTDKLFETESVRIKKLSKTINKRKKYANNRYQHTKHKARSADEKNYQMGLRRPGCRGHRALRDWLRIEPLSNAGHCLSGMQNGRGTG